MAKEKMLNIDYNELDNCTVVSVHGRVDTITSGDFQKELLDIMDRTNANIIMDLSDMEYISSAGLSAFLLAAKTAKARQGVLYCCCLSDMVQRVFQVSGFSMVAPIYSTLAEAKKALQD
jgi:anti-anti-sigma factor